ncbi:hypothetical protein M422DRAFT_30955 [Sphaerobolus stellatus SS14]|uniref:Uncharacterized protein n=1 Tax=Sphaerobolus stellatus (strain SS14) TaxID=990650 RepID=A0A0C9VMZ1_SPHS4|nr:hypothetical protein M422DRAFT_30955 [Sphaerobolus stellatus SS14]
MLAISTLNTNLASANKMEGQPCARTVSSPSPTSTTTSNTTSTSSSSQPQPRSLYLQHVPQPTST